jgi:cathepsin L
MDRVNSKAPIFPTASGWFLALLLAAALALPAAAQQSKDDDAVRLKSAPAATRILLQQLEEKRQREGWGFTVGYTEALDIPDRELTGASRFAPVGFLLRRQKERADRVMDYYKRLRDDKGIKRDTNGCDPAATAFDWRAAGKVTPVRRSQGRCGSCWAFAAIAAFESSYLIENGREIDSSEQYVLNCTRRSSCSGGSLTRAMRQLTVYGTATETAVPYEGRKNSCSGGVATPYDAVTWAIVSDTWRSIVPPDEMKKALCDHGPIATRMIVSDSFKAYTGGVYQEVEPVSYYSNRAHFVVIVGWDEEKGAWLIKNSWNPRRWGEEGFAWIKYGANLIGHGATWIQAAHLDLRLDPALIAARRDRRGPIPPGPR